MIRKRTIATLATLGGLTASVALLSGLPAAKADELADLRANQELLQRRLDQLAQAQNVGAGSYMSTTGGGPSNVQMMGGSFPRSFLIPGTDTSIRVGGEARLNMLYWFNGGNPNSPHNTNAGATGQLNNIPLSRSGAARNRDQVFILSPQQSKISVETRTPTAWGEARSFIEFDFSNLPAAQTNRLFAVSDNISLRLRYAYGTLGPWLGGQANSNFSDPDSGMETLSFSGLAGGPGHSRVPQLRYTAPLAGWGWGLPGALSFSIEQPETEFWAPAPLGVVGQFPAPAAVAGNPTQSTAPDLTAAWYIPQPWGHVDFSAVLRPTMTINDGVNTDKRYVGWGLHFGGDVKPRLFGWDRDFITWQVVGGQGVGGYMNIGSGNSGLGLVSNYTAALSAASPNSIIVKPVNAYGGNVGFRHYWAPNLRSNIGVGVYHADVNGMRGAVCSGGNSAAQVTARQTGAGGCGLNKELLNAAVNLIWNPVPFVDFGVEYMYGHRLTVGNQRGDENVLLSRMRVQF